MTDSLDEARIKSLRQQAELIQLLTKSIDLIADAMEQQTETQKKLIEFLKSMEPSRDVVEKD